MSKVYLFMGDTIYIYICKESDYILYINRSIISQSDSAIILKGHHNFKFQIFTLQQAWFSNQLTLSSLISPCKNKDTYKEILDYLSKWKRI